MHFIIAYSCWYQCCFLHTYNASHWERLRKKKIHHFRIIYFSHSRVSDTSTMQVYYKIDKTKRFLIIIAYVLYMRQHFSYNICINIYVILCVFTNICVIDIFSAISEYASYDSCYISEEYIIFTYIREFLKFPFKIMSI